MNHVIIKPLIAEKFQMAMENGRIIFFSAPCGFGKTTTATNLLKPYKVRALSADDVDFTVPLVPDGSWDVLLIDQFQFLKDTEQQALCELIRNNPQSRFVFLSRGVPPGYLAPFQFSGLMLVFTAQDLLLDLSAIGKMLETYGINASAAELAAIQNETLGYPAALSILARNMSRGVTYNLALADEGRVELYLYFDDEVYQRFDLPIRNFLLKVAPFESFDVDMAKMLTGDCHAGKIVEYLQKYTTMLFYDGLKKFYFWDDFRAFLMWKISIEYTEEELRKLYNRGGLYYELKEDYAHALEYYSKGGDDSKVSEILVKNSQLHPGMAHYDEMEYYYRHLPEDKILASPALMQGMCMLCSLCTDYQGSERWYKELQHFAELRKRSDASAKEARSRLAWLDISLPQRKMNGMLDSFSRAFRLMCTKEVALPPFSVTSTLPSLMNGGKDFSEWSKKDDLLYKTMKIPIEAVLGKDGIGLAECAIAESKFEKGEDVSTKMLNLVALLPEIQQQGTADMEFAVVGLLARTQVCAGRAIDAERSLLSLRERFEKSGEKRFFANIDAMLCRIALYKNDENTVSEWYREKAPKDPLHLKVMKRYQYLTQAMAEIALGDYRAVLYTLAPLENYFVRCERHIDTINMHILRAIAKYRLRDDSWQEDFSKSLDIAWEYKFIIPHSQYAQAVLSLLEETKWAVNTDFVKKLLRVSRGQAVYYPDFLHFKIELSEQLTAAEMQVLRLLCADKSNAEIGEILDIKLTTVKSHVSHILQKLGVKRRSEAKTAAEKLRLL